MVRGWDPKADSIGQIGLDRRRFADSVLDDAQGDGEESRRGRQCGPMVCEVDEPETSFPSVKRSQSETLINTELSDFQTAGRLATDTVTPECVELGVGSSRHRVGS
jgi:hypothetical protein